MPTTIRLPLPSETMPRLRMRKLNPFHIRTDLIVLTLWAITLLSIGAVAQFVMQSPELNAFEQLALF